LTQAESIPRTCNSIARQFVQTRRYASEVRPRGFRVMRADRQTDKQTHSSQYCASLPRGRGEETEVKTLHIPAEQTMKWLMTAHATWQRRTVGLDCSKRRILGALNDTSLRDVYGPPVILTVL